MDLHTASELDGKRGELVDIVGVYRVVDMGRYKYVVEKPDGGLTTVNHFSVVHLDDGTSIDIGPRSEDEHALQGRRVRARGRFEPSWPPRQPPHVAQPDPRPALVQVVSVEPV